jgi:deazaflavin-dependent oxidoreductase (nitroreductase family)
MTAMTSEQTTRYLAPPARAALVHRAAKWMTARGLSLYGSRILRVRGRKTGAARSTLVNLLEVDGVRYLVAPRGHTQWVRNLRAASGEAELALGRHTWSVTAVELADDVKLPVLRAYLKRFGWEVGAFFENLTKNSTDAELAAVAPDFPAFRLDPRP